RPDPTVVATFVGETGGNPFFVGELIRHLEESGAWAPSGDPSVDAVGLPSGIREVVGQRLARLSNTARSVLGAAACFGDRFPVNPLVEVTDVGEDAVLAGLDEAALAGLVEEEDAERFRFSHGV